MKLQKNQDRINYLPNREKGHYIFDGLPYASMQVLELIGSEGVHHIDQKLKDYLLYRMEMFGNSSPNYYGFAPHQRFFDIEKQVLLDVKTIINQDENGFQKKDQGYTININDNHDFLIDRELEDEGLEAQISLLKNGVLYNETPIDSKS